MASVAMGGDETAGAGDAAGAAPADVELVEQDQDQDLEDLDEDDDLFAAGGWTLIAAVRAARAFTTLLLALVVALLVVPRLFLAAGRTWPVLLPADRHLLGLATAVLRMVSAAAVVRFVWRPLNADAVCLVAPALVCIGSNGAAAELQRRVDADDDKDGGEKQEETDSDATSAAAVFEGTVAIALAEWLVCGATFASVRSLDSSSVFQEDLSACDVSSDADHGQAAAWVPLPRGRRVQAVSSLLDGNGGHRLLALMRLYDAVIAAGVPATATQPQRDGAAVARQRLLALMLAKPAPVPTEGPIAAAAAALGTRREEATPLVRHGWMLRVLSPLTLYSLILRYGDLDAARTRVPYDRGTFPSSLLPHIRTLLAPAGARMAPMVVGGGGSQTPLLPDTLATVAALAGDHKQLEVLIAGGADPDSHTTSTGVCSVRTAIRALRAAGCDEGSCRRLEHAVQSGAEVASKRE